MNKAFAAVYLVQVIFLFPNRIFALEKLKNVNLGPVLY